MSLRSQGLRTVDHCGCALVAEKKKANMSTTIAPATKENAPNLTREKKCWTSALLTYSKVWSIQATIGCFQESGWSFCAIAWSVLFRHAL
jgi:hypothetical protein